MKSLRFQIKQKGGRKYRCSRGADTTRLITPSSWIIRITSWTTLGQGLDKRGPTQRPPSLLYPANFQHLHADTRIGSGFSFATAIQSCKSGGGVALLVAAIELLLDRRTGGREREREEERPTNPGFT